MSGIIVFRKLYTQIISQSAVGLQFIEAMRSLIKKTLVEDLYKRSCVPQGTVKMLHIANFLNYTPSFCYAVSQLFSIYAKHFELFPIYANKVELFPYLSKSNYFLIIKVKLFPYLSKSSFFSYLSKSNYFPIYQFELFPYLSKSNDLPSQKVELIPKWFNSVELFLIFENRTVSSF